MKPLWRQHGWHVLHGILRILALSAVEKTFTSIAWTGIRLVYRVNRLRLPLPPMVNKDPLLLFPYPISSSTRQRDGRAWRELNGDEAVRNSWNQLDRVLLNTYLSGFISSGWQGTWLLFRFFDSIKKWITFEPVFQVSKYRLFGKSLAKIYRVHRRIWQKSKILYSSLSPR